MISITVSDPGFKVSNRRMARMKDKIDKEAIKISNAYAHLLVEVIKDFIDQYGMVETGAYKDSWQVVRVERTMFQVFSEAPQAFRLEYGYVGLDARGRHYTQAPRPHLRPAVEAVGPLYLEELERMVPRLWQQSS